MLKWLHLLHCGGVYARGVRPLPAEFAAIEEMKRALQHFREALQDEALMWAGKLLELGMEVSVIAEATGLDEDAVRRLRQLGGA